LWTGWLILPKSTPIRTNEVEDGGILFWDWGFFFRGHLTFVKRHVQLFLCYQIKPFHPSINQSPTSGQTNQGTLFEPRNTSPLWQRITRNTLKIWWIGVDYKRKDYIISIQCKN
jgi:hypothetical protein